MSHEQLTPLNAILNVSSILIESSTLSEPQRQSLQVIWSSGRILELCIQS